MQAIFNIAACVGIFAVGAWLLARLLYLLGMVAAKTPRRVRDHVNDNVDNWGMWFVCIFVAVALSALFT